MLVAAPIAFSSKDHHIAKRIQSMIPRQRGCPNRSRFQYDRIAQQRSHRHTRQFLQKAPSAVGLVN